MEEWETTDDDAVDDQDYLDSTSVQTYVAFRLPRPSSGSLRSSHLYFVQPKLFFSYLFFYDSLQRYADMRAEWQEASAEYGWRGGTETLQILGAPVMEDWEAPYMEALVPPTLPPFFIFSGTLLTVHLLVNISSASLPFEDAGENIFTQIYFSDTRLRWSIVPGWSSVCERRKSA